jgi:hypothetical protein
MTYPNGTFTKNKEVRVLEEKGQYVKYTYINADTGELIKKGKYSLLLKSEDSRKHLFIIPLKNNKSMIVKEEADTNETRIYDKENKKEITF